MKQKGYALLTVIVFSSIIALIISSAILITNISSQSTLSEVRFQKAEALADSCLLKAIDKVNATGVCGNINLSNSDLGINSSTETCTVSLSQHGKICFIRAEGSVGLSKVHKTAVIQAFYGVGLYTVRGSVNATYSGGLLTGCYYETNNNCFVPAFIASSGTVSLGGNTPENCPSKYTNITSGIWGTPPTYTRAQFRDLVPLFFNVNCFASNFYRENERCNYGLTDALVETYGIKYSNNKTDFRFSPYGEPVINEKLLSDLSQNQTIQDIAPNCKTTLPSSTSRIDLSNLPTTYPNYQNCRTLEIYVNPSSSLTITGNLTIQNLRVFIYIRERGSTVKVNNLTGSVIGFNNFGENIYNVNIYTLRPVEITTNSSSFRLLTTNTINVGTGITINNTSIIQALEDENQNNDPSSPQNFIVRSGTGTLTLTDSKLITRQLRFGTLYAWRDLVYVYANACPKCSRDSNAASLNACNNDARRCGWAYQTGSRAQLSNNAYFGTDTNRNIQDTNGESLVSILINNNSVVRGNNNFFGGIYFGQDVNYIRSSGTVMRGFLVINFPNNLLLNTEFNSSMDFQFRLDAINNLRYDENRQGFKGFWFVRKVDCVREDQTPAYMPIITRMTSW